MYLAYLEMWMQHLQQWSHEHCSGYAGYDSNRQPSSDVRLSGGTWHMVQAYDKTNV